MILLLKIPLSYGRVGVVRFSREGWRRPAPGKYTTVASLLLSAERFQQGDLVLVVAVARVLFVKVLPVEDMPMADERSGHSPKAFLLVDVGPAA